MLEHRKCTPTQQGKVLIYYQIYSNTTWRQVTANGTKNSSNSSRQTLGICESTLHWLSHQTFCMHKAMVPVVVNVHLPACGCYTYSITTVKLCAHSQSVKNLWTSVTRICICCRRMSCHSSVADHWVHKPGILGLIPGSCRTFHFALKLYTFSLSKCQH